MLDCKKHIIEDYPFEACGVIIKGKYYRCPNVSENPKTSFIMEPRRLADLLDIGDLEYIVHSHCDTDASPSKSDLSLMPYFKADWIIYSCIDGKIVDRKVYDKVGKEI